MSKRPHTRVLLLSTKARFEKRPITRRVFCWSARNEYHLDHHPHDTLPFVPLLFGVSVASPLERDRGGGGGGETRRIIVFGCRVVKIKRLESREKSFVGSRRRKQWHHHRRAAIEAIERSRRRRRTRHRRRARTRGRTTDAPRKGTKREDWCLVSSPLRGRELTMDDTSFYFSLTGASRRAVAANKRTTTTTTRPPPSLSRLLY